MFNTNFIRKIINLRIEDIDQTKLLYVLSLLVGLLSARAAVLLKNEEKILPLAPYTKVCVKGPFAEKPRFQGAGSSQVNATKVETISGTIGNYGLILVEKPEEAESAKIEFPRLKKLWQRR